MKKISLIFSYVFCLASVALSPNAAFARQNQPADWMRVQSDDGEFSIEVPAEHAFFVDKKGFSISKESNDYRLEEMSMLNAYVGRTLLSFEGYKANKKALDIIREADSSRDTKFSEIRGNGYIVKQVSHKTDEAYIVRRYINSKNRIYVLTAASRDGETPEMKRFFDSLMFSPSDAKNPQKSAVPGAILFSNLKVAQIEVDQNPEPLPKRANSAQTAKPAETEKKGKALIVNKHRPYYTSAARMKGIAGNIQVRVTLSERGFVSKIGFLKTLPEGLDWQALFAAIRIKFLPAEKDGAPVAANRVIEYSFSIY